MHQPLASSTSFLVAVLMAVVLLCHANGVLAQQASASSASSSLGTASIAPPAATQIPRAAAGTEHHGDNIFVYMLLAIMTGTYLVQGVFAFWRAGTHKISDSSLLKITFDGGEALNKTWLATVAILVIPFLLSWIPTLPHLHTAQDQELRPADVAAFYAFVSLITVLITVELTLLFDLRNEGKKWQTMLVVALGLDIVSLFLFTGYIEPPKLWKTVSTGWTWAYMSATAAAALVSSFVIVLFSKSANELAP